MRITLTKKVAGALTTLTALSLATPAFAQTTIDPCSKLGSTFNGLCHITSNNLGGMVSNIITILFIVAALIALFFLIWGGIKWILSGGDKAKVESARSTIIAALIGLVITFLAFFLLTFVLGLFGISVTNFILPNLIG
jgi:hypothetical protein